MPINVLFDISMLGVGHAFSESRTGIFRVVENLAFGLYANENCKSIFCATQNNIKHCRGYLGSNEYFTNSVLSEPDDLLGLLYGQFEPLRLEFARLPQKRWKTPLRKIYHFGKKFVRPIKREDIQCADIFHSPWLSIPKQVQENQKISKFITIHDLITLIHPEFFHKSVAEYVKVILKSINPDTNVFCVSESTKNDLLTFMPFLNEDKISVSTLAAGDQFYKCEDANLIDQVKVKYNIPVEGSYLLALGTLQPRKNFEQIISSFIELVNAESVKDLSLVIVGSDGWSFERIYNEITGAGEHAGKIIITGYVPDEDLAPLYSGALAFVYPSLYEGFGLPPLEAMQCGTPVITSNNSSLPEVVGDAAIMIDPRDGDALCQEMLNLYQSAELRLKLSEASIERARFFSWEKTISETVAAYKNALSIG